MRRSAIVLSAGDFSAKKWAAGLPGGAPPPPPSGGGGAASGKAVFTANGCGSCHTLTAAGSTGTVGPNLDKLPAEAKGAGQPLEPFIRESIVNPNKYIAPGYPAGVMPQNFGQTISKPDLDSLVQYLVQSSEGGGK
jgi:cytochrome c551/c552